MIYNSCYYFIKNLYHRRNIPVFKANSSETLVLWWKMKILIWLSSCSFNSSHQLHTQSYIAASICSWLSIDAIAFLILSVPYLKQSLEFEFWPFSSKLDSEYQAIWESFYLCLKNPFMHGLLDNCTPLGINPVSS